jgi:hypothetical protein
MQNAGYEDSDTNPFRFLDLPPELRKEIYEYYLFTPRYERNFCGDFTGISTDRPLPIDSYYTGPEKGGPLTPAILKANHQLRKEAGQLYYSKGHDIYLGFMGDHPIKELAKWRSDVVGDLAVHLRDLRLHINYSDHGDVEHEYTIHIKLSPYGNGLTAEDFWRAYNDERSSYTCRSEDDVYDVVRDLEHLPAYTESIERRRVQLGQQGEAVLDLVLANPRWFRYACWGPPVKWVVYGSNAFGCPMRMLAVCDDEDDPDQLPAESRYF